jgi:GNAT superfamily N-acetyltransferase
MSLLEWKIERFADHHDRSEFADGRPSLDSWIKRYAGEHEKRDLARTYVLVRPEANRIAGYYAISTCQLAYQALPADKTRKLPNQTTIPAILLGRLAIDSSHHGQGLGGRLLIDVLRRIQSQADQVGIMAVVVDAIDDQAVAFYLHHQFIPLLDDPRHLFLPVATIRKLGLDGLAGSSGKNYSSGSSSSSWRFLTRRSI